MGKGRRNRRISSNKNGNMRNVVIGVLIAAVIVLSGLTAFSFSIKSIVKDWDEKIYPGVTIQNLDVSNMTKEEAKSILKEKFEDKINDKVLTIDVGDDSYELEYIMIDPNYDIDDAVEAAYNYGKEYGVLGKYATIKKSSQHNVDLGFNYDEDKLEAFESDLIKEVSKSPKNATLNVNGGNITVVPEVNGITIDSEELDKELKDSINGMIGDDTVNIDTEVENAEVTADDLSKITGVMGTFSTSYGTSAVGRSNNIEIATKAINGTIVMPGETFSFNDVVGPRTEERGYKEAGTYVGNKVEPGIGGGICQVSTTLYRAAMRANLRSADRTNHSMSVGYAKPGLDATVSYGYLDYKFTNKYDFPIYIEGTTAGKIVTYSIYGDPSALNGKTYDMDSEIVETLQPETKTVEDNTIDEGKEQVDTPGTVGYRTIAYQITYENGVEVEREIVSRDTYAKVDSVIKKGTKKPEGAAPEAGEAQGASPDASSNTLPPESTPGSDTAA